MPSLIPLKQRALALIRGARTYKEVSDRKWTLCPGETYFSPPAIYLDGQLEKVTHIAGTTTYADEMQRVRGGVHQHAPTEAYQLLHACVLDGRVYKGPAKYTLTDAEEQPIAPGLTSRIPEAALACTLMGYRYFGHWMIDDLSLTLAARDVAEPVTTNQQLSPQQIEYCGVLGVHATPVDRVRCDSLVIIDDRGLNRYRRERIGHLRSRLRSLAPAQAKPGVMLLRGTSGVKRILVNEEAVASYFSDLGFAIVDPLRLSAAEVARQCAGAQVVVGVTGSQLMPGFLSAADGGLMLLIQPPFYFENCYKDYGDSLGIRHAFVVGDQTGDGAFEVDLDDVRRTLDRVLP